jgi:hypothetical protein
MVDSRQTMMRSSYRDDPETHEFPGERMFSYQADLHYVLEPATERPDALVVAFSAAHEPGEPPRYYTTRVLRAVPCHRLFILDDHGPRTGHARPSWYLGAARSDAVPASVEKLMDTTARELGLSRDRVVTCGASKGGWAALYFAARFGAGHAVAGEPQAFLGRHLLQDGTWDIAAHIAGGTIASDGDYLDDLLFDAFRTSPRPPDVHLFCGQGSAYYERDVLPLSRFLAARSIFCEMTVADFSEHVPDLGVHFPPYLTDRLNRLLEDPTRRTSVPLTPAAAPAPPSSPLGRAPG